jgi:hypothetical protein
METRLSEIVHYLVFRVAKLSKSEENGKMWIRVLDNYSYAYFFIK